MARSRAKKSRLILDDSMFGLMYPFLLKKPIFRVTGPTPAESIFDWINPCDGIAFIRMYFFRKASFRIRLHEKTVASPPFELYTVTSIV
jgi:hypothetical protein